MGVSEDKIAIVLSVSDVETTSESCLKNVYFYSIESGEMTMETRLVNFTWPEIEEIVKKPHVVIVPTGSIEQHGPHLPLSVDYRCPEYVAELAAKKVMKDHDIHVLVAPPVQYGEVSLTIKGFPGCIGVYTDTAMKLFEDIARTLIISGFKDIIFLNGHATNVASIIIALKKVSHDFPEAGLFLIRWLGLGTDVIAGPRKSEWGLHADELETAASLVIQPENVHMERAVKEFPSFVLSEKWIKPDICGDKSKVLFHTRQKFPRRDKGSSGVMGDPTVATKEMGELALKASAEDLAEIIVETAGSRMSEVI